MRAIKPQTFEQILKNYIDSNKSGVDLREEENPANLHSTEKPQTFDIQKTDEDQRLVFGWASIAITADGEQLEDLQHDIIDPDELEQSVYKYVLEFRDAGEEHIPSKRLKGKLVESVVFTKEKMNAMGIPEGIVPEGWWIGFYVSDDEAWRLIKNGTYQMFSIEGKAIREAVGDDIGKTDRINGCGVLVVKDGKILTGTRTDGKHKNQICGPGGHIERGETHEEAAIRETSEEFGIQCTELEPLGILDGGRNYGKSAVFLCTAYDGEPKTDEEEMTDLQWRTIDELQEERLFYPFEQSLELLSPAERHPVAKGFKELIEKFNPFHDSLGKFSSSNGFASYSANPKTKAGAMAISRSAQAGHGTTFNVHRESQGENINQNYNWLNGGPGAKVLAAQGQLASQQAKPQAQPKNPPQAKPQAPPKPQKNYDRLGYADYDDADFHQLYNGRQYYQQQQLSPQAKNACNSYLNPNTEPGSLYNFSQNMNQAIATGTIDSPRNAKYKAVRDEIVSNMHNLGHNVTLTRYDHGGFLDDQLKQVGINSRNGMSVKQLRQALVGHSYGDNRILSTSYNDFKNATNHSTFSTREVKIVYKAKANTQVLMPGDGPGGKFGEMLLGPTGTGGSNKYTITEVNLSGAKARAKGSSPYNLSLQQIEIVVEVG